MSSAVEKAVPPAFMFGFDRSGTTLLSMMMGAHPELAVPLSVTGLWYRYDEKLAEYGGLVCSSDVERLVDDLLAEERIGLWDVDIDRSEILDGLEPGSYAAVIDRFHRAYARHKGKPHWGNLDIWTLERMHVANRWFPEARFLQIVRDGRDVALSHETMPYGSSNTLECAGSWMRRIDANLKMGAMLGPERYQVVRYEDLILDTEKTLERLCRFFGLQYSDQMLAYPEMVDKKVPEDRRWLWPALNQPPDRTKAFGWKKKMGPTKRIVFEGTANDMLRELGYEAYDRVPKSLSAYVYELFCFVGRGGRFRRWARRFGLARESKLERAWKKDAARTNQDTQRQSFGSLVERGVYGSKFEHGAPMQHFFGDCMQAALQTIEPASDVAILDCGCGPGAWLDFLSRSNGRTAGADFYGFDLTPQMIDVARERLRDRLPADHLRVGDVLEDSSYAFDDPDKRYQLIYAFDVVQQLPPKRQFDACLSILRRVAPGGCAVIFDHDRVSRYGRVMGFKKAVTKYLKIGLVPKFYCNAKYPPLARFASRLAATGEFETDIRVAPDGRKRALIVQAARHRAASTPAAGKVPVTVG